MRWWTGIVWLFCAFQLNLLTAAQTQGTGSEHKNQKENLFDFSGRYTGELMTNLRGGLRKGESYIDLLSLDLRVDGERLFPWRGTTAHLIAFGTQGGSISKWAGDLQGISNIEATRGWYLLEAWLEQMFLEDRLSLLVGKYDLNSEFDSLTFGQLFVNSSHGIGADLSLSGTRGPSIFPYTSLGVRVKGRLSPEIYLLGAATDGRPGLSGGLSFDDGILLSSELGYQTVEGKKLATGFWSYAPTKASTTPRPANQGFYLLAEKPLRISADGAPDLAVFVRFGVAESDLNPVGNYFGTGITWTGPFKSSRKGVVGVALATAARGRQSLPAELKDPHETILEFTYRIELLPWLSLQPDLQWVLNPGMRRGRENSLVVGTRFEVCF